MEIGSCCASIIFIESKTKNRRRKKISFKLVEEFIAI